MYQVAIPVVALVLIAVYLALAAGLRAGARHGDVRDVADTFIFAIYPAFMVLLFTLALFGFLDLIGIKVLAVLGLAYPAGWGVVYYVWWWGVLLAAVFTFGLWAVGILLHAWHDNRQYAAALAAR